jgi:TPR repeat protein
MHLHGLGGEKSQVEAFVFLTLAKEQWVPEAAEMLKELDQNLSAEDKQAALQRLEEEKFQRTQSSPGSKKEEKLFEEANRYAQGKGTQKDPSKALEIYLQAARRGHVGAQFAAGFMLEKEERLQGREGAVYWYQKAASQSDPRAQYRLGALYYRGRGVQNDPVLSYGWTRLAADQELPSAKAALKFLDNGISSDQKKEAISLSDGGAAALLHAPVGPIEILHPGMPVLRKSPAAIPSPGKVERGHPFYPRISASFKDQDSFSSDQALHWANSAAESGSTQAQVLLGERYHQGLGVVKDYDKAAYWYSKAAMKGNPQALSHLAYMQVQVRQSRDPEGSLLHGSQSNSSDLYHKAVEAQFGVNREADLEKARELYSEAVRAGNHNAMVNLALMLWHGLGGHPKIKEAAKLLKLAQKQGSKLAGTLLAGLHKEGGRDPEVDSAPVKKTAAKPAKQPTKTLEQRANEGEAAAQLELGVKLQAMEGKQAEARGWLEKALNQGQEAARKPLVTLRAREGAEAFEKFDNKNAIEIYKGLMAIDPEAFVVLYGLTRAYDSLGSDLKAEDKRDEAEKVIRTSVAQAEKLRDKFPNRGETWVMMGVTTGNLAKFLGGKEKVKIGSKVEEYCKKAIETDPSQGMAYAVLATYYLAVSELPWLLKTFAKSFLGGLPDVTGDDALELYRKGVKASPNLMYANFKLGQLLKKLGKKEEASKYLKIAAELEPKKSQETRTRKFAQKLLEDL